MSSEYVTCANKINSLLGPDQKKKKSPYSTVELIIFYFILFNTAWWGQSTVTDRGPSVLAALSLNPRPPDCLSHFCPELGVKDPLYYPGCTACDPKTDQHTGIDTRRQKQNTQKSTQTEGRATRPQYPLHHSAPSCSNNDL